MVDIYNKLFNLANLALSSQQQAMGTASQNIANANTEGYSRQRVVFESIEPDVSSKGFLGGGVRIRSVERLEDRFLGVRINSEMEEFGRLEQKTEMLGRLEVVFNETDDIGLNNAISDFFNSWRQLAGNATVSTARTDLLNKAEGMVSRINKMDADMRNLKGDIDNKIVDNVSEINSILDDIANYNSQIHLIEAGDSNANDLRDKRDIKLKELAQKINISYYENPDNEINIVTSKGYSLVEGVTSFTLSVSTNSSDSSIHDVIWNDLTGNEATITSAITSGELGGLLELRDTILTDKINKFGGLAAGIVNEVNSLHIAGYGLDGKTGRNFFDSLAVSVTKDSDNTGSASVSSSVVDPSSLMRDDYRITIASATTFTLQNVSRGASSGTYTFSSGTEVLLPQGLSVTITGTPDTGDIFDLSANKNAALNMSINADISDDINKIAASASGERDDGDKAQNIADLQVEMSMTHSLITSGTFTFTFQDFFSSLVGEIGSDAKFAENNFSREEGVVNQLNNLREAVSGVSIDEEMLNVIKFQRAYQAAAKLITIVDDMFGTLLDNVGR